MAEGEVFQIPPEFDKCALCGGTRTFTFWAWDGTMICRDCHNALALWAYVEMKDKREIAPKDMREAMKW